MNYMHEFRRMVYVLVFTPILLTGCVPSQHKASALRGIEQFHSRFNDFRFAEVYDGADSKVKAAMSRDEFVESMKAMREGQGRVLSTEEIGMDYDSSSDVVRIKILMLVTFEKGQAREEFVYQISEGEAVLAGYRFLGK